MSILFLNQTINYKTQSTMYQPARSTPVSSCLSLHRDSLLCGVDPHGPWLPCFLAFVWSAPRETWQGTTGSGEESEFKVLPLLPPPVPVNLPSHRTLCLWGQKTAPPLSPRSLGLLPSLEQPWLMSSAFCHSWFICSQLQGTFAFIWGEGLFQRKFQVLLSVLIT